MIITAKVKLLPTPDQAVALREIIERVNAACNWLSGEAWEHGVFRQFNLSNLVQRVTVGKGQRTTLHSWAFAQLGVFISYKSKLAGVVDFFGDPRNTSRTCPVCGLIDKRNRKTRDLFVCVGCGHTGPADHIAAINIRNVARRAVTDQPYAAA